MKQEVVTVASMQSDHRQWDYEHSNWRADIEHWQREHESALSQLAKLQELIRQHGEALHWHTNALEQHQQSLRNHKRAMSVYQTQGGGERLQETLAETHGEHAQRHKTQQVAHERIKKHHHTVMAHLTMLKTAIEAAM